MNTEKLVVVYDGDVPVAVLENAFNIVTVSEVNADSYLEFDLYFTDQKRPYIDNQATARIEGQVYRIKEVTDKKEYRSAKTTHVYAENIYYDLAKAAKLSDTAFDTAKARSVMTFALQNTEWNIGIIEITSAKSFESECKNPLELLQLIADVYNGELVFDSENRLVNLVKSTGSDNGMLFHYKKNMKSIERVVSTTGLVTRLYATGADGLTFASVNNGLSYVEDFSYTDEVLIGTLDCSSFTDAADMLDYAKLRVADYCRPTYSYTLSVIYLESYPGYSHEKYGLGDVVRVVDEELGIDLRTRIIRMEKDILEPWNTKVELSTTIGTLSLSDDSAVQEAVNAVLKSFVAPRLVQATIDTVHGEVSAMYELGVPVKYSYEEKDDGIVFTHPDGLTCEIKVI